jgi:hypothetical protein
MRASELNIVILYLREARAMKKLKAENDQAIISVNNSVKGAKQMHHCSDDRIAVSATSLSKYLI